AQERDFYDRVPVGGNLRAFGAIHTHGDLEPGPMTSYRRWWNHPWKDVEPAGQPNAGAWTAGKGEQLRKLVKRAHDAGLWIRFYTLNGHDPADESGGWTPSYNFGSLAAVRTRWMAARDAGVDFIATDQYEELAAAIHEAPSLKINGTIMRA